MKKGSKAILAMAGIALVVLGLVWPREEPVYGMSAKFLRHGVYPFVDYGNTAPTNALCAVFGVTNTGNRRIYCRTNFRGVGGLFAEVMTTNGWDTIVPAWGCLAQSRDLEPGEGFEVPVVVRANLSWRTSFGFCPYAPWESIPNIRSLVDQLPDDFPFFRRPEGHDVWTDPVPAPGKLWPQP
jgi:hypothetical protein